MAWRDTFYRRFGPGLLGGLTFGHWLRVLRDNRFRVSPAWLHRAAAITWQSAQNSFYHWFDQSKLGSDLEKMDVPPPLFVLGHWRHGTTHLHNLLSVDERFAFPNNYQVVFPASFLTAEPLQSRAFDFFLPKRRPMDNVEWSMRSPQEDEFALCLLTFKSPYTGWVFPQRREHYDRYLTFRDVDEEEIAEWKAALLLFLKKLTWKLQRPLILKSPPHTCRIKLLLELFPGAKFVHIHRNPYDVFPSSRRTFQVNLDWHRLQRPPQDLDEWILRQYRTMYQAHFEQRDLIRAGHFHEMSFEALERDPVGELQRLYEALELSDFSQARPAVENYVRSIAGYQKNRFPEMDSDLRIRIADQWRFCFDAWGY